MSLNHEEYLARDALGLAELVQRGDPVAAGFARRLTGPDASGRADTDHRRKAPEPHRQVRPSPPIPASR